MDKQKKANQSKRKRLTYLQYKRKQRILAIALLLACIFFIVLGFALSNEDSTVEYTFYQLPTDRNKALDEIFKDATDSEHMQNQQDVHSQGQSIFEEDIAANCEPDPYLDLSDTEKHELACLIYLEGRGESIECQKAIGSVVLNRYTTSEVATLHDTIYAEGQFSPAHLIDSTEPTDIQIQIVEELCELGTTIPQYVVYFRADYYHTWDTTEPYINIDNTYFSASKELREKSLG